MKKQIFFCLEYPKNGITATTGGGEEMNLRHIKEKIEDKMLDPDFTSKVSLAVSIVSLVAAVLVLYVKLKYRTV